MLFHQVSWFCFGMLCASTFIVLTVHGLMRERIAQFDILLSNMLVVLHLMFGIIVFLFLVYAQVGGFTDSFTATYLPLIAVVLQAIFGLFSIYEVLKNPLDSECI